MTFDPDPAAQALYRIRLARTSIAPLPAAIAPGDLAQGIAVQLALARRMGAIPPGGFKIGATAQRMQAYLGLTEPAVGFMPREGLLASGASVPWSDLLNPGVECEIAVRLARDLPAGHCNLTQAADAVGAVLAAIEIVENRYGPPPAGDLQTLGTPTLIADQVYHARAVLGAPPPGWRTMDLQSIAGRITVDDEERGAGHGRDLLGHPLQALAWLAATPVIQAFGGLRAGQVVMLGSVTPPIWLEAPCRVTVVFEGLPAAEVRFT
jgi:2-keto-4-pentenoate hydratase